MFITTVLLLHLNCVICAICSYVAFPFLPCKKWSFLPLIIIIFRQHVVISFIIPIRKLLSVNLHTSYERKQHGGSYLNLIRRQLLNTAIETYVQFYSRCMIFHFLIKIREDTFNTIRVIYREVYYESTIT